LAWLVLATVLLAGAVLAWVSLTVYNHDENRLLDLKAKETASVVTAAVPSIETPLASAAELADVTGANATRFDQLMKPYVVAGRPFVSISLWSLDDVAAGPVASIGARPALASDPARAQAFFRGASRSGTLALTGIVRVGAGGPARLGYAFATTSNRQGYAAYGESALPDNGRLRIAGNSAFSNVNFALYIGTKARARDLLGATLKLPVMGRHATVVIPFGDSAFTIVVSPIGSLSGNLSAHLPWIVGLGGAALAFLGAALTDRLVRRRRQAEALAADLDKAADENRALYAQQRTIAHTLQDALLPQRLPDIEGAQVAGRYIPGMAGIDIGGDWYDIMPLDDGKALFVVGDVSGRGLGAAAMMASLRYALRGYAKQGDPPEVILCKLSDLVSLEHDGHFATVLCAELDVPRRKVTMANAGHLPPLVTAPGAAPSYVWGDVGMPVGVTSKPRYVPITIDVPPRGVLLAFTDGLVERRGEPLDAGLERLRHAASARGRSLEDLMETLVTELCSDGSDDDTAILGVGWDK
jgi:serine phosphatase RsbU (regulator of sigma subunit)